MVKPTSISLLRGEEDPDCTLSNVGELLKSKAEEGVRVLLLIWNDKSSGGMFGMNPYMVLSNGTPKNNKNKNKKINLPKIVAYGTFRRNRLHSAARTNKNKQNSGTKFRCTTTHDVVIQNLGQKDR